MLKSAGPIGRATQMKGGSYMKKRLISLLLAVFLLAALTVPAFAADYSDLSGHWAETYLQKLSDLGYLNGYTDGTIRPDGTITTCEAIALVSRFYEVDSTTAAWIEEDYGDFVGEKIDSSLSWAYDEIETCLAAGILSESELLSLRLTAPIEKELLSVLLVRALQLTNEAVEKADTALTFADADSITAAYVGHVAVLVDAGIVEGDNANRFTPHASVTRGVAAAMVVRGLNYVESQGKELEISGYDELSETKGLLTAVDGSSITIRDLEGVARSYNVPASASVTVSGEAGVLSSSSVGLYATIRVESGVVQSVKALNEEGITWAQGKVTSVSTASSTSYLNVENLDTGKNSRYTVPSTATITRHGEETTLKGLSVNDFVTLQFKNSRAAEVTAEPGDYTVTGKITSLTYGTTVTLTLAADDGAALVYLLDITDLPTIKRGSNTVSIERLAVGDELTVTVEDCEVKELSTAASESTIDGTLTSIVTTTNGTTWVITDTSGSTQTFEVDASAGVYQGSKSILLSDIQAGDTISVVAAGGVITEVYLKSSNGNTSTKFTGTVLAVDTSKKSIMALTASGKLVYISTASVSSILNTATGDTIKLSALKANSQIIAYGSYADSTNFTATSIVIES